MDRLSADRMFVQVVRQGSFAAAAQQLGVSSGQASKLVSALESDLGVRLLNRTTRATALTAEGETYFTRIAAILDQLDDLDGSLRDAGRTPKGTLRLTAPLTFGTVQLVPALADFAKLHPGILLDVQFTDSAMSLAEHGFDAAIRVGEPRDSALKMRKLAQIQVRFVAAATYLRMHGVPRRPEDLARHDIITDTNFARPDDWSFGGDHPTLHLPGRLRFSNAEACVIACAAGLGIAHIPDFVSASAINDGRLIEVLKPYRPAPSGVYAITPAGRHMPSRLRVLIDFLLARWGPDHNWAD
ncbi:LysR family transcriptional regulator [Paracoccus sp. 11-3]|uniref:LysR family transcriptional regulator n=1 Tax=Paracoccus amoyensis TaxID=2760093 RepID=A0A926JE89_9RHOB|nr:LysR family transcriptional regulator [Paracoccus amoyensis]MBC9247958.1 LysR family transcriptional regulator [Paracoccus amoyensis]